jgi:hypothetical protein
MDGTVNAWDLKTGKYLWSFSSDKPGLVAPYPNYPIYGGITAADGKIFVGTGVPFSVSPLWQGMKLYAINANTGQGIWNESGWYNSIAIADGYLVTLNNYDQEIYCFGKGQTATTISAPQVTVPQGTVVMIQGTVADQSPGTTCLGTPAAFTPAVSDESMSAWMDYLYMQQSKPTNVMGVKIHLTAFDPNNNTEDLGYVTSDASGNYALQWTPPVPGIYKVTASFEGSNSYFSSSAVTAVSVSIASSWPAAPVVSATFPPSTQTAAPITTIAPTPSPVVVPATSGMPIATYVAVASIVVIIVAVAAALILRRRK